MKRMGIININPKNINKKLSLAEIVINNNPKIDTPITTSLFPNENSLKGVKQSSQIPTFPSSL